MNRDEIGQQIDLIDEQINQQENLYREMISNEAWSRSDLYGKTQWNNNTIEREKEIFHRIDQLQAAKTRLITGEKPPEIVFVDRPVETIKYIEREVKHININKSGLSTALLYFILICLAVLAAGWYFDFIEVFVQLNTTKLGLAEKIYSAR